MASHRNWARGLGAALAAVAIAAGAAQASAGRPMTSDSIADLAAKAAPAVVNIDTVRREINPMAEVDPFFHRFPGADLQQLPPFFEQKGVGSGFILASDGLVVTNAHVIEAMDTVVVTLNDGRHFQAQVVGQDPASDLALLRIGAKGLPTLSLADMKRVRVGEWVVAIGSPFGLSTTVTAGILSAINRDVSINDRVAFLQTDAPINPGNSGGPLLNMDGEVIGINTAIRAGAQGISFAVPVDTVRFVTSELRSKGHVDRAWLGVVVGEAPEGAEGVLVRDVTSDGPAARAGLVEGDLILQVNGKPVKDALQLTRAIALRRVGDAVTLLVSRDGDKHEVKVVLLAMPPQAAPPSHPVPLPPSGSHG